MARRRHDMPPLQAPHNDAGLQPERTSLAWGRTLLVLWVVACLYLRWMQTRVWLGAMLAVLSVLAGLYIWMTQRRRYRRSANAILTGHLRADVVSVLFTGGVVAGLSAVSLWAVLGRL
ncbi:DUF202 domain-containing protein [Pseudomonas sp. GD03860]|uniref:DUF202 domain-containing protein n=1 Tax=Pseudomonas TaxID=286 RepID=UPI0023639A76|nr:MULTISPECIES: DUF202 domain-containing protein [Pseudomonas]MDD2056651.1 DUF202 domain-containing protein [Pseudomonas putida]MDH0638155.1 DUF202 domain-containing protein [Pseudomonas sp. GD03860]